MFMTADSVVFLDYTEMIVWKTPDLKPLNQEPDVVVEQQVFSFSSLLGSGTSEVGIELCGRLCDWYWNMQEVILDICSQTNKSGAYTISRCKLSSQFWSSTSTCPRLLKRAVVGDLDIPDPALTYRFCEDSLIACSTSLSTDLYLTISGEEPESFVHIGMHLEHPMNCVKEYSLCPLSGRICYVTDADELEIAHLFTSIQWKCNCILGVS